MISATGRPRCTKLAPRSPRRRFPMYMTNCSGMGLSTPKYRSRCAIVSSGNGRLGFLSNGLPGARCARLKVIRATKNIVGMINRSRRITYLSTDLSRVYNARRSECVARNERGRLPPAPFLRSLLTRSELALLGHVDVGPVLTFEPESRDRVVLDPRLLQDLGRVVVDERGRGVRREEP